MASLWERVGASVKKRAVSSAQGYDYEQDWLKVGLRFLSGGTDFNDAWIGDMQQRIYGTALKRGTQKKWKKGDLEAGREVPIRIRERIDQMLLASEQPVRYGDIIESQFKPGVGAEEGEKFYTFKDTEQMSTIYRGHYDEKTKRYVGGLKENISWMESETKRVKKENIERKKRGEKPLSTMFNVGYSSDVESGKSLFVNPGVIGMGRFQVGVGEDEKGKYMSIYDKWDIDAKTGIETAEKFFDWAMPGFEMYDRVYYEEKKKPLAIMKPKREIRKAKPSEKKIEKVKTRLRDRTQIDDKVFGFLKKGASRAAGWLTEEVERD